MVTSTKNPTSVVATETTLGGGTLAWTNPTNIYTENGAYANSAAVSSTGTILGGFKLYDSSAYVGDLMDYGTISTSALTWSTDTAFTGTLNLTPAKVNNSNFGVGQYFARTRVTRDLRSYGYGFTLPTDSTVLGASSRSKHYLYTSTRVFRVDVVELTVTYELGGSQSPSSSAYFGGGPAMFRSPTDLFNILKKPIWEQRSRSNRFILRNVI